MNSPKLPPLGKQESLEELFYCLLETESSHLRIVVIEQPLDPSQIFLSDSQPISGIARFFTRHIEPPPSPGFQR